MTAMRILYLDQNAWIALAKGAWDRIEFPNEHAALAMVIEAVRADRVWVPLSFANIYETAKINDPARRHHLAGVQSTISAGRVFRSRRQILGKTLVNYLSTRFALPVAPPSESWFLSNLWFESAAEYAPATYGFEISDTHLDLIRSNAAEALFHFLTDNDEETRVESVRQYSAGSASLIAKIEARREALAAESLAIRRRAYGALLVLDELDFILTTAQRIGLDWTDLRDIGPSLVRRLVVDIPVLHTERELVVRLESQKRPIDENDLRDMASFVGILPFADVVVAEKPFVNLARQARLERQYETKLLTSVIELDAGDLANG